MKVLNLKQLFWQPFHFELLKPGICIWLLECGLFGARNYHIWTKGAEVWKPEVAEVNSLKIALQSTFTLFASGTYNNYTPANCHK